MRFPKHLQSILWDVDTSTLNQQRHQKFIITRVAEKGAWNDIVWLKKIFGRQTIKNAVAASRNTSAKTKNFWKLA